MFCKNCGKQIEPNSKFCQYCGQNLVDINIMNNTVNNAVPNYTLNSNSTMPNQIISNNYNNIPNMPNNEVQQKSGNPILVMMIVVFLILAVSIPIVVYLVSNDENTSADKKPVTEETVTPEYPDTEQPSIEPPNTEEPNIPSTNNGSTKVVNHSGYNYTIPSNYTYENYDGNLVIYDDSVEWMIMFTIAEYSYDFYKQNINLVDAELSTDYENVTTEIKKYQNIEYIETDLVSDGIPMRMLYFAVDDDTTVLVMLMTMTETKTVESLFNIAYPIVVSIEEDSKHVL